jgi:hypothetical protein
MSNVNKKAFAKKALTGAVLLATSPAWGKGQGGGNAVGKSQLGVNHLSMEIVPGAYCTVCADQDALNGKTGSNIMPNTMSVAVDPFQTRFIELIFQVRDILAQGQDHVLFLLYSPQTSPSPQIPTPKSRNGLELDTSAMEVLAIYNIPAQKMIAQPKTRIGQANPAPHSTVSFSVNLDTSILPTFMDGNEKVYLQAALMKKEDFDEQKYSEAILSDLDTLSFVPMTCPENHASISVDVSPETGTDQDSAGEPVDPGTMTVTDTAGNVSKVTATASAEANATIHFGVSSAGKTGGR